MDKNFELLAKNNSAKVENSSEHIKNNLESISSELSGLKDAYKNISEVIQQLSSDVRSLLTTQVEIANTVKQLNEKTSALFVSEQGTTKEGSNVLKQMKTALTKDLAGKQTVTALINDRCKDLSTVNSSVNSTQPSIARTGVMNAATSLEQLSLCPAYLPGVTAEAPILKSVLMDEIILKLRQFQVFSTEKKTIHPVVFIKTFKGFLPETWTDSQKIYFTIAHIQGEAALWATETAEKCKTYEQFEQAFLAMYWSPYVQSRLIDEVLNPEPYNSKKGTLRKYFEHYINKTRFFDKPVDHSYIIMILIAKLPFHIKKDVMFVRHTDFEYFVHKLDELDSLYKSKRGNGGAVKW